MPEFKVSTAASIVVGPILDAAGAEYAGAVIGDLSISKNGGTLTAMAAAASLTIIANGYYTLLFTTGNLDTLGNVQVTCNKVGYQMPPVAGVVRSAPVFGGLVDGNDVLPVDATQIDGATLAAQNLAKSAKTMMAGIVSTGSSTTSITTTGFPIAGVATNQFNGRYIIFREDTFTTELRNQACLISGSSIASNPTFTVSALTHAPSSGDTFVLV